MLDLLKEPITVHEDMGEVAGAKTERVTHHEGAYVQVSLGTRLSAQGHASANAGLVVIKPQGFGTSWSLKAGDTVTVRGVKMRVAAVDATRSPQTNTLHHVEAQVE